MEQLKQLRNKIDLLDEEIFYLLIKRFDLSQEVKNVKQEFSINILDNKREEEILNKIKLLNSNYNNNITLIYQTIMEESKKIQKDK